MKFCPHCGAALPGGAAPFCPECGKKLASGPRKGGPPPRRRPPRHKAKKEAPHPEVSEQEQQYDGYYEDVAAADADRAGDRIDPALIKRILLLVLGTIGVIVLAVLLMLLL